MRLSGQSSSVVSQWMGKGSKEIKSIRQIEAAFALGEASGYHPVWIAVGTGPKAWPTQLHAQTELREPSASYQTTPELLNRLCAVLGRIPPNLRNSVADLLAGIARDGADGGRVAALVSLLDLQPNDLRGVA
jgi:hypothetical protein